MSTQGSKAMNGTIDKCRESAGRISCIAVRIYSMIRDVGRGVLSADNALHLMIEDYKDLRDIYNIANAILEEANDTEP